MVACDIRVGCGGWWCFPGGLRHYRLHFSFVEVNTAYYALPPEARLKEWRRIAGSPEEFEFSLKAPRSTPKTLKESFPKLVEAARILEARYVVVHASQPGWAELAVRLLDAGFTPVIVPAPPTRGRMSVEKKEGLPRGFLRVWDPVFENPPQAPTYARVFGAPTGGVAHHLGSGMLKAASERLTRALHLAGSVRVVVHTYRMAEDARRLMQLLP
ncbi:hypothetical protein B9Q04_12810 [Candidatus Marsarchaeota G2 archaeon BE_D]|uniref:DUF72 domain-containing protein n=2 Tax=Candidatus Marsarchaeota group 2 TaxID=2203771 RepID=A0A2R6C867_9ARCH|nr:MAG: hypothetical protein B9Q08_02250 [Candidatus Marsarchaeota G2 archaeon ECH_B_SAG-M15]PSO07071.1 MAG: hypothetical protein B9Q04_12810 [Candidatus Marsarchaeota G2 archaeon BE_D]